ncbi:MAG: hypothetical protein CMF63_00425 [Magnetovibrio sp.]|nr:hypothetical protein [Magnetovibrio sp.]
MAFVVVPFRDGLSGLVVESTYQLVLAGGICDDRHWRWHGTKYFPGRRRRAGKMVAVVENPLSWARRTIKDIGKRH